MTLAVPPPSDRKRVKVYELRNNDWFDRGTGFCIALSVSVRAYHIRHSALYFGLLADSSDYLLL